MFFSTLVGSKKGCFMNFFHARLLLYSCYGCDLPFIWTNSVRPLPTIVFDDVQQRTHWLGFSPWLNVCTDLLLLKRSLLSLAVGRYCVSVFLLYLVSSPVSCQQLRNRAPSTGQVSPGPTWLATGKCFRADRPAVGEPHRTRDAQSQCHCTRIPGNERREGSNELM